MNAALITTYPRPGRLVSAVAAAVALCILGDSLLYNILPLAATQLAIPLELVGVLLSANRLVRLGTNSMASALFERWGPFLVFFAACGLGLLSTSLYALSQGFLIFLFARLLWGAAWSALRQGGYQAVWSGDGAIKGRLTGLLWGIIRLGSALSVVAGGFLYDHYGFQPTLMMVTAVTALALPVAYFLPWPAVTPLPKPTLPPLFSRARWQPWRQQVVAALAEPRQRWLIGAGGLQLLSSSVVIATSTLLLSTIAGSAQAITWLGIASVGGRL